MPYFDGSGPQGQGPLTGRRMGPCGQRRGFFGIGQGRFGARIFGRNCKWTKEDLQEYKKSLEEELKAIEEEINAEN